MNPMTERELLTANGNRWRVACWRDGNRRTCDRILYVTALTRDVATRIARKVSGRRTCDAVPWNPMTDLACFGYVERT